MANTLNAVGQSALTAHGVLVGEGTSTALTSLAVGSTGTLLVGSTGADPAFGTSATGDFTFTSSAAGATRTLTVSNTDNTNSASTALVQTTVGGASAGDPVHTYTVTGATSFTTGIDNSASDAFKISASTALGTTDTFIMTTAGERTMPLQPAFLAYLSSTASNVTGDGTVYTVIFDTEKFDQNNDYNNGTGQFVAPVQGNYLLSCTLLGQQFATSRPTTVAIVTTGGTYNIGGWNLSSSFAGDWQFSGSVIASMAASDVATITITTTGGTKVVDVAGSAASPYFSTFSGSLIC